MTPTAPNPGQAAPLAGKRILVLEDEMLIALDMEEGLRAAGCDVAGPYSNLADGMAAADTQPLDAALLDINVRGGRSFDIARRLEERGVPFLFLSGYRANALEGVSGSWQILEKPVQLDRLLSRLRQLLRDGGGASPVRSR